MTFIAYLTHFRLISTLSKIPTEFPQALVDSTQSPYPSNTHTHGNPHTHGSPGVHAVQTLHCVDARAALQTYYTIPTYVLHKQKMSAFILCICISIAYVTKIVIIIKRAWA